VRRWLQIVLKGRYIRHWRTIVVGVSQIVPKGRYIRHSGTIVDGVRHGCAEMSRPAAHRTA
jgi:hypothetical protein